MVMLLFATNIATFWPRQKLLTSRDGLMVKQLSCAFTIVLVIFYVCRVHCAFLELYVDVLGPLPLGFAPH